MARSILYVAILAIGAAAAAIGTAQTATYDFAYEGRLTDATGKPLDGPIALRLSFYREESGGNPIMAIESGLEAVELQDGIFQVSAPLSAADYGTVFPSPETAVFVEVTDLTHAPTAPYPRRQVTTLPYAARVPVDGTTVKFNSQGRLTAIPPGAGKLPGNLVQLDGSSRLPALDGSQLTGVSATSVGGAAPASTNTASTLVKRDSSGNFSAGTITANVTGNVSGSAGSVQASGVKGFTAGSVPFANASGLTQNNAKFFWDNANSRLGIGTAGPVSPLHVANASQGLVTIETQSSGSGGPALQLADSRAGGRAWTLYSGQAAAGVFSLFDAAANAHRLVVDASGNVGIGTASPAAKLDVTSNSAGGSTEVRVTNTGAGIGSSSVLKIGEDPSNSKDLDIWYFNASNTFSSTPSVGLLLPNSAVMNSNGTGGLTLMTSVASPIRFATGGAAATNERMRIDASGNVGIGTTSPQYKFDIAVNDGNYDVPTFHVKNVNATGAARLWVENDTGQVTSFSSLGSGFSVVGLQNQGVISTTSGLIVLTDRGVASGGTDSMKFLTGGYDPATQTRMLIDSAGNVGIGTTTPGALLDVKGHVANSGASASVGTCGTAPAIVGNDTRGRVTVGGGGVTSCAITFAAAFATAPYCTVTWEGVVATNTGVAVNETTTDMTVFFSADSSGATFNYNCLQ